MTVVATEINVCCNICNAGLCNQTVATPGDERQIPAIRVNTCKHCLARADEAGFKRGTLAAIGRIGEALANLHEDEKAILRQMLGG